jgi:hypothetical protein
MILTTFAVGDLAGSDQFLSLSTWHLQKWMRLRPAFDRSRFVAIGPISDSFLADQFDQPGEIGRDPSRFIQMTFLERADRVQRPLEAEPSRLDLLHPRRLRHHPTNQIVTQEIQADLLDLDRPIMK